MVIDQTSDPGLATMRVLLDEYPRLLPFSKTAKMQLDEFESLPARAFAWPGARRFPVHTPEHAALSLAYTKKAAAPIPADVVANLARAVEVYGIPADVFTTEKTASDFSGDYLIPTKKRFRVKTAEDVKLAECFLFEKFAGLTVEDRTVMAQNLVATGDQHKVTLAPRTHKLACTTMTNSRIFRDWMRARQVAAEKRGAVQHAKAYETLGRAYTGSGGYIDDPHDQTKLAACIYELDKQAGLVSLYGRTLLDPLQTVYNTELRRDEFIKVGSAFQNRALIESLPLSFWQDVLGEEIAQEIAPNGQVDAMVLEQILPTLPADMKRTVEMQLAAYNK